MNKIFILSIFILLSIKVFSQDSIKTIKVIEDPRLEILERNFNKIIKQNNISKDQNIVKNKPSRGFRIQIYSGNNRVEANNLRNKFIGSYPGTRAYLIFLNPYYKIRIGDYTTKAEASKMLTYFQRVYPNSFIISDYIK